MRNLNFLVAILAGLFISINSTADESSLSRFEYSEKFKPLNEMLSSEMSMSLWVGENVPKAATYDRVETALAKAIKNIQRPVLLPSGYTLFFWDHFDQVNSSGTLTVDYRESDFEIFKYIYAELNNLENLKLVLDIQNKQIQLEEIVRFGSIRCSHISNEQCNQAYDKLLSVSEDLRNTTRDLVIVESGIKQVSGDKFIRFGHDLSASEMASKVSSFWRTSSCHDLSDNISFPVRQTKNRIFIRAGVESRSVSDEEKCKELLKALMNSTDIVNTDGLTMELTTYFRKLDRPRRGAQLSLYLDESASIDEIVQYVRDQIATMPNNN